MAHTLPLPPITKSVVRPAAWVEAAAAFSFANLCYFRVWSELLTYSRADAYLMKLPYSRAAYLAVMLNVLMVGAAGWALASLVQSSRSRTVWVAARSVFFALLLVPLNALRSVLANTYDYLRSPLFDLLGIRGVLLLAAVLAAAALTIVLRWPEQLLRAARAVLLILSPLVLFTFAQAMWRAATYDASEFRDRATAPPLGQKRAPRVLWVILDEWDYRITFVNRPAGLPLPEMDRLRRESFSADNAAPPGPETLISMPALLTGRAVSDAFKRGPSELLLVRPGEARPVTWRGRPNIFDSVRTAGFDTALVGWYHPYCRELASSLTHCEWWKMSMQYNTMGRTLAELIPGETRSLFETSLLSAFGQSLSTSDHSRTYREMMVRALAVATDPAYGFTLLHLPVPHAPHAYSRRTGRFDLKNSPIRGYADSLALADRTIGDIRRALEKAGLWDSTAVLFTSDHGYRSAKAFDGRSDPRIPFLLKLPGQAAGMEFAPPFDTLLTGRLLLAILRREVATPRDAVAWIGAHQAAQR
ncbi:MAG TPA: sulfatase-like hydrolase/transferase [Bryobacteraceae bacterium]